MVETTQTTDTITTFATLDEDNSNKEFIYVDKLVLYSGGYDSTMLLHKVANDKAIKNIYKYFLKLCPLIRKNITQIKTISLNKLIFCDIDK